MKQIEINGILWDAENLEIDGKKYFTWQEAMDAAKSVGKRLPTKEEFEALIKTGCKNDSDNKGIWFANREIFFPLLGYINLDDDSIKLTTLGFYWSSSLPRGTSYSWHMESSSSTADVNYGNVQYGFPVRCVQDIPDNYTIEEKPLHTSNNIDWEQRQYEIAKYLYCCNKESIEDAISYANEFIKKLKEHETI